MANSEPVLRNQEHFGILLCDQTLLVGMIQDVGYICDLRAPHFNFYFLDSTESV
jgi:hypothetical protein